MVNKPQIPISAPSESSPENLKVLLQVFQGLIACVVSMRTCANHHSNGHFNVIQSQIERVRIKVWKQLEKYCCKGQTACQTEHLALCVAFSPRNGWVPRLQWIRRMWSSSADWINMAFCEVKKKDVDFRIFLVKSISFHIFPSATWRPQGSLAKIHWRHGNDSTVPTKDEVGLAATAACYRSGWAQDEQIEIVCRCLQCMTV